jgi:hypothetical protein
VTSAKFEDVFLRSRPNYMNDARSVFLLVQTFKHHVVALLLLVLNKTELVGLVANHERVGRFADLTLKSLPEVAAKVC